MYSDPDGHWPKWWNDFWGSTAGKITLGVLAIGAAVAISVLTFGAATPVLIGAGVGFVIGGGFALGGQLIANGGNWGSLDWGKIGMSAFAGAVAGAISAIPVGNFAKLGTLGKVISYGLTFVTGGAGAVVGGYISGSVTDGKSALIAFALGGAANVLARGIADKIGAHIQSNANKMLTHWKFGDMTLRDLVGASGSWQKDLFKALMNSNGQFLKSATYMLINSSISSLLSGWY